MVIPLIVALSLPSLMRFEDNWSVGKDAIRYLFAGFKLASDQGLQTPGGIVFNGGHGPVFPALIGSLILIFGRDVGPLVWAVRLLALPNALLAYLLARRISGPLAGLIATALAALFCSINLTFNIDTVLLAFCLSALLALLGAISKNRPALALLSGLLLGLAILTKESAVVYVPLSLLAVLLLGWEVRGALWHYLGVVLACLPWWVWCHSATGGWYLLDRLPPPLRLPFVLGVVTLLATGALAYATGAIDGYLAGERPRRWTGWHTVLAWTASLTGLVLYAGPRVGRGILRGPAALPRQPPHARDRRRARAVAHLRLYALEGVQGGRGWTHHEGAVDEAFGEIQAPACLKVLG